MGERKDEAKNEQSATFLHFVALNYRGHFSESCTQCVGRSG